MGICHKLKSNITFLHIDACMHTYVYMCVCSTHVHIYVFITTVYIFLNYAGCSVKVKKVEKEHLED